MQTRFFISFVFALCLTLYFLGSSITGYVTGTMHCVEGRCYPFCDTSVECIDMSCCEMGGFGVCAPDCEVMHETVPDVPNRLVHTESPSAGRPVFFGILMASVLAFGLLYYILHQKH